MRNGLHRRKRLEPGRVPGDRAFARGSCLAARGAVRCRGPRRAAEFAEVPAAASQGRVAQREAQ